MDRLRIAVVGVGSATGARSSSHLDVIARLSDKYELCALCDVDRDRLQAAGEHYGVRALYTNLDAMLAQEHPDVAYRLTPTDSTTMVCLQVAEAGVHLINEIPIASTLPQADAIIEACERNNVKLEVAENVWLWPQEQLKQKIVRSGLLGQLTYARLKYPCGAYHGFNAIRMILAAEPSRVLGYCGEVEVQPQLSYGGTPMTRSFFELGVFEFDNGVCCSYEMPPKGRAWRRNWDIEGTHGQLYGETLSLVRMSQDTDDYSRMQGETEYPIRSVSQERDGRAVLKELRVDTDPPIVWENPFWEYGLGADDEVAKAEILMSMYRAVTEGIDPLYGGANGRRDLEMWIAVRESGIRGGEWMDFPVTEFTGLEQQLTEAFKARYGCDPVDDVEQLVSTAFTRHSVMWDVAGWL